jgi:hypothetical protein
MRALVFKRRNFGFRSIFNSLFTDFSGQLSGIRLACQMTCSEHFDWNNYTKALNPDSVSQSGGRFIQCLTISRAVVPGRKICVKTIDSRTIRLGSERDLNHENLCVCQKKLLRSICSEVKSSAEAKMFLRVV